MTDDKGPLGKQSTSSLGRESKEGAEILDRALAEARADMPGEHQIVELSKRLPFIVAPVGLEPLSEGPSSLEAPSDLLGPSPAGSPGGAGSEPAASGLEEAGTHAGEAAVQTGAASGSATSWVPTLFSIKTVVITGVAVLGLTGTSLWLASLDGPPPPEPPPQVAATDLSKDKDQTTTKTPAPVDSTSADADAVNPESLQKPDSQKLPLHAPDPRAPSGLESGHDPVDNPADADRRKNNSRTPSHVSDLPSAKKAPSNDGTKRDLTDSEPSTKQQRPAETVGAPAAPPSTHRGPDELTLIEGARRALPGDPQSAWAYVQKHERHFSRGILVEEREVLAIEALHRLGRMESAQERARQFQKRFPSSVHLKRILRITGRP